MWKDPIVEEIHAIRRQIAKECSYDIRKIVKRLQRKERAHRGRLVRKEDLVCRSSKPVS